MEQEQLTEVRGFAAQEVGEVEASTLEKLEELKQEYEVEVEQLASDLVVGLFSSPSPPPRFFGKLKNVALQEPRHQFTGPE